MWCGGNGRGGCGGRGLIGLVANTDGDARYWPGRMMKNVNQDAGTDEGI